MNTETNVEQLPVQQAEETTEEVEETEASENQAVDTLEELDQSLLDTWRELAPVAVDIPEVNRESLLLEAMCGLLNDMISVTDQDKEKLHLGLHEVHDLSMENWLQLFNSAREHLLEQYQKVDASEDLAKNYNSKLEKIVPFHERLNAAFTQVVKAVLDSNGEAINAVEFMRKDIDEQAVEATQLLQKGSTDKSESEPVDYESVSNELVNKVQQGLVDIAPPLQVAQSEARGVDFLVAWIRALNERPDSQMSPEEIEALIEQRVEKYRDMAEQKYAEFYVSVEGQTPYIVCSTKSGRYLGCTVDSKPKVPDWKLSSKFEKAYWFSSIQEAERLIKKLAKARWKGSKRLEIRRVYLKAPD